VSRVAVPVALLVALVTCGSARAGTASFNNLKLSLGGSTTQSSVILTTDLNQAAGEYTARVVVVDKMTKSKQEFTRKIEILDKEFGIIRLRTTRDPEGNFPSPPIGVAGLSKGSDTLKLAGERGFWPMSLNLNPGYVSSHWDAVEEGAARSKRTPKRSDWRMVREVFVADTDAEALRLSAGGMMGRMMTEYFLPLLAAFGFTEYLKHDPSVPDSDVTPEYCAKHNWLIGSPATVSDKLNSLYEEVGGFGTLLVFCFDYSENPKAWHHSMELLAKEVMPRFKGMVPK